MAANKRRPKKAKAQPSKGRAKATRKSTTKSPKRTAGKAAPKRSRSAKPRAAEGKYGRRRDYGVSVDDFVAALPEEKRNIVNALREIIRDAVPGVVETIRWGMPVFARKKLICYASTKTPYVRFGFYARIELDDPDQRLAGSLAYVKLNHESDIERPLLDSWIRQVVEHTDA